MPTSHASRPALGSTLQVLRPAPNLMAFYDGRLEGTRAFSDEPNWLDDGAYSLGTCTYALVEGEEALLFDTHISIPHAALVRRALAEAGVTSITVVLSHWHVDHVAGNEVFADCEIIANELTGRTLEERRAELEDGTPPVRPLVMPTRTFEDRLDLQLGPTAVELHCFDIHSQDGTVLFLPATGLLLAGDTLEDTVTYVTEPDRLDAHLKDLDRLAQLPIQRILPNHGAREAIEAGGYGPGLIEATRHYVEALLACRNDEALSGRALQEIVAADLEAGHVGYWPAYEEVHRRNVQRVRAAAR